MRKPFFISKLSIAALVCLPLAITFSIPALGDTTTDKYFSLRRQYKATELKADIIKANPSCYIGKVIELRGKLSGSFQNTEKSFFILDCGDTSYVIDTKDVPDMSPGARLCILAQIGEKCTLSLSELKLVALEYENTVVDREEAAAAAEAAKKARLEEAKKQREDEAMQAARTQASATSRSGAQLSANEFVVIYRNAVKNFNPRLSDTEADTIARSVLGFSMKYEVDPRLVMAVILAESHFNPHAKSPKGAAGLGQLMPGTAAGLGVSNAFDPVQNVEASVRLIRGHLDRLSGNAAWTELTWQHLALALASYNAGPGAVRKYGGIPPYRETQGYVKRVISIYRKLCGTK